MMRYLLTPQEFSEELLKRGKNDRHNSHEIYHSDLSGIAYAVRFADQPFITYYVTTPQASVKLQDIKEQIQEAKESKR